MRGERREEIGEERQEEKGRELRRRAKESGGEWWRADIEERRW